MKFRHAVAATLVIALWGGNYVAARFGMESFPPLFYTALRFMLVAGMIVPFVPVPAKADIPRLAALALVLCIGHMGLILVAIHQGLNIPGTAIVMQMGVPFSCLLSAYFFKDRIGVWRMTGLLFSFSGVVAIAGNPNVLEHPHAYLIALVSAFFWAASNIQLKGLKHVGVFQLLGWQSLLAVPMLLLISYLFEDIDISIIQQASLTSWAGLAYTVLLSSLLAYGMWSWLIRSFEISRVAPYSLLLPVFAIGSGQLFFREALTPELIIGGLMTIVGVAIITVRRPALQKPAERI